ncbi:MAG: cytochrome c [Opitutae bacterium]|nr:cytochrome c [Opitutae bacterium]
MKLFLSKKSFLYTSALLVYSHLLGEIQNSGENTDSEYAQKSYLTFDLKPMGSMDRPLILRTFVPTLSVSTNSVLSNHSTGSTSPKYSPSSGKESTKEYQPIDGIPAAIAVNLGKHLSYVWDTTECRLLYAWTDGFFDMKNYWGDRLSGRRKGFGYVPRLFGFVFYKALGKHPLSINGKSISGLGAPRYTGYSLGTDRLPVYEYKAGKHNISLKIQPGPSTQTLRLEFSTPEKESLQFSSPNTQVETISSTPGKLSIVIRPNAGESFSSDEKKEIIKEPTQQIGEKLYTSLGCIACHSLDGGKNHGPTLKGSFGSKREFLKASSLAVDESYIRESIEHPMAKTVKGYLTGMMPPYKLQQAEYDSLILFIKSVR